MDTNEIGIISGASTVLFIMLCTPIHRLLVKKLKIELLLLSKVFDIALLGVLVVSPLVSFANENKIVAYILIGIVFFMW